MSSGGGAGAVPAPPAPVDSGLCELVVDGRSIGRVKLRRSLKIYSQQPTPTRLVVSSQIKAARSCFNELVKLPHWAVEAPVGEAGHLDTFFRSTLKAQKGVAVAHVEAGGGGVGCFLFTQRRLYFSTNADIHIDWPDLTEGEPGPPTPQPGPTMLRAAIRKDPKPAPPTAREVPGESNVAAAQEPTAAPEVIDLQQEHPAVACDAADNDLAIAQALQQEEQQHPPQADSTKPQKVKRARVAGEAETSA